MLTYFENLNTFMNLELNPTHLSPDEGLQISHQLIKHPGKKKPKSIIVPLNQLYSCIKLQFLLDSIAGTQICMFCFRLRTWRVELTVHDIR
jgi:hypothetical protein